MRERNQSPPRRGRRILCVCVLVSVSVGTMNCDTLMFQSFHSPHHHHHLHSTAASISPVDLSLPKVKRHLRDEPPVAPLNLTLVQPRLHQENDADSNDSYNNNNNNIRRGDLLLEPQSPKSPQCSSPSYHHKKFFLKRYSK